MSIMPKMKGWKKVFYWEIDHLTVVCLVTWPLNENEAGGDTLLLFLCKIAPN